MFAGRAAAEVFPRQQNTRIVVHRLVQDEVGVQWAVAAIHVRFATIQVAPFVEQKRAEAATPYGLEELLGDDGIGVDVGPIQRNHPRVDFF